MNAAGDAQMWRAEVVWFADAMERKLRENDHKRHWRDMPLQYLSMRLTQERKELYAAIASGDAAKVLDESADVANFAMMVADVARYLYSPALASTPQRLKEAPTGEAPTCRKCGGTMVPGKAIAPATSTGADGTVSEAAHVGPAPLVDCMKCERCGWSVAAGVDTSVVRPSVALPLPKDAPVGAVFTDGQGGFYDEQGEPLASGVTTPLSDFIRNASPERKADVYGKVMEKVDDQQRAVIDSASGVSPVEAQSLSIDRIRVIANDCGMFSDAYENTPGEHCDRFALAILAASGVAPAPERPPEWLLYEHDDGRYAVAPSAEAATFARGDPAWHRVGPVAVPDGLSRAIEIVQAEIARAETLLTVEDGGRPLFDRAQTEAGIAALRTVAEAIERERTAGAQEDRNG